MSISYSKTFSLIYEHACIYSDNGIFWFRPLQNILSWSKFNFNYISWKKLVYTSARVPNRISSLRYIPTDYNALWYIAQTKCPTRKSFRFRHEESVVFGSKCCYGLQSKMPTSDCGERLIGCGNTVGSRSIYWTQISYIGLGCASSNIAFFVQYNLYWTVNHPISYNIYIFIYICICIYICIYIGLPLSLYIYISPV